jgi:hypothetical protein
MNGVAGSATAPRCRLRGTALRIDFRECGHSRAALRLTRSSSWVGQIVTLIRVRLGSKWTLRSSPHAPCLCPISASGLTL